MTHKKRQISSNDVDMDIHTISKGQVKSGEKRNGRISKGLAAGLLMAAIVESGIADAQIKTEMRVNGSTTQIIVALKQGSITGSRSVNVCSR